MHPALGIDYGDTRVGVAATDPIGILAHPVETIDVRRMDPIERIAALVSARQIQTLVVGLPLNLDGEEGKAVLKVRHFANKLKKRIPDIPLEYIDESLSTVEAAEKLRQAGRSAKKQKAIIDQAAAVEILNRWMG
ncbi:MAG: Holliday junction resolvase RuvX [Verrucomicrobiales bacterium]